MPWRSTLQATALLCCTLWLPVLAGCSSAAVEPGAAPRVASWLRSSAAQGVLGGRSLRSQTDEREYENRLLIGSQLYTAKCASCHDERVGRGRLGRAEARGPNLLSRGWTSNERASLHELIREGRNQMPPFEARLTSAQLDDLIEFLIQSSEPR